MKRLFVNSSAHTRVLIDEVLAFEEAAEVEYLPYTKADNCQHRDPCE